MNKKSLGRWTFGWFAWVPALVILSISPVSIWATEGTPPVGAAYQASGGFDRGGAISDNGSGDNFLFTGSFLYNYPIEVPPGVAGMQPEISLQYSSNAGNSWVGQGWDLSFGAIQRSTKNGKPRYDQTDTFIFTSKGQSQELVEISDGTYRAKIEGAFQQFIKQGDSWLVLDKSGMKFLLGDTAASRITMSQGVYLWALRRVSDANGNTMSLSYVEHQRTLYPTEILYTSNLVTNRAFDRKVTFVLETRPDVISSYRSGTEQRIEKRLQKIETFVNRNSTWDLVKRYQLNFSIPTGRVKSELVSLQSTGFKGTEQITLPASTFQYAPTQTNWDVQPSSGPFTLPDDYMVVDHTTQPSYPQIQPTKTRDNGMRFVDLNGDGRTDIIQSLNGYNTSVPEKKRVWLNTPNGWQASSQWFPPEYFTIVYWNNNGTFVDSRDNGVRFADLNGDGLSDMVISIVSGTTPYHKVYLNTGSGWSADAPSWHLPNYLGSPVHFTYTYPSSTRDNGAQFADMNGDGRPDLVYAIGFTGSSSYEHVHTWLNTGSGWIQDDRWNLPYHLTEASDGQVGRPNGVVLTDLNGDGLTDFAININNNFAYTYLNTGSGWALANSAWNIPVPILEWGSQGSRDNAVQFTDLNADGLVDIVYSLFNSSVGGSSRVYLNTGQGWQEVSSAWTLPEYFMVLNDPYNGWHFYPTGHLFLDVDGDGIADLLRAWKNDETNQSYRYVGLSRSKPELVLNTVNPLGGATALTYDTTLRISGTHRIPFPVTVLTQMTQEDGRGGASIPIHYSYTGGYYDPIEREYLGFARTDATDGAGHTTKSYYLQDLDPQGQPAPANAFKGRLYKTEEYGSSGPMVRSTETRWEKIVPWPGVHFVRPLWTQSTINDSASPVSTKKDYFYDDAPGGAGYGNVTRTVNEGDAVASGDEQTQITEYAANEALYILAYPKLTRMLGPNGETLSETKIYYDGSNTSGDILKGNVTRVSVWRDRPTVKWITTESVYNNYGQVTEAIDALQTHTNSTYDTQGFLASITNALGHQVGYTYDIATGNVLTETDVNNQVTTHRYDALGRETKVIGPLDSETFPSAETDYHTALIGQSNNQFVETFLREEHGQAGTQWSKSYFDGLGRNYKSEKEGLNNQTVVSESQFDNRGLVTRVSVPRNPSAPIQWSDTTYDVLGRVVYERNPDQRITTHGYYGRASFVQDANGKIQASIDDAYGRVVSRYEPGNPAATTYEYNAAGLLSRLTDSQGHQSNFTYDSLGRKLSMSDPNTGAWRYTYDDNGQLSEQTDARGAKLVFDYDALGRVRQKISQLPPTSKFGFQMDPVVEATYTYDENDPVYRPFSKGHLTTMDDASGVTWYSHDAVGHLVRELKKVDTLYYDTSTTYDALGRIKQISYPSSRLVKYIYNTAGQLDRVTNGDQSIVYASYPSYNALGQLLEMRQSNDIIQTQNGYHPTKHLLETHLTRPMGSMNLQNFTYSYDPVGNMVAIADHVNTNRSQTFTYDDLYRLTSAQSAYGNAVNTFDRLGNFQTKDGRTYQYQSSAHPYAVTSVVPPSGPALPSSFTYDANGSCISKTVGTTTTAYNYDVEGRLVRLQENGVTKVTFIYDANGERSKKITPSPSQMTLYIGKIFEIRPPSPANPGGTRVDHVFGGGALIADLVTDMGTGVTQIYYYQTDHLGSTTLVMDSSGAVVQSFAYEPFGKIYAVTGGSPLKHKYTQQEDDESTGLYYYNARYYDPELGRFTSADIIVPSALDPQSLNRYAYVRNNPIILVDPSGNSWLSHATGVNWNVNRVVHHNLGINSIGVGGFAGFGSELNIYFSDDDAKVGGGVGAGLGMRVGVSTGSVDFNFGHGGAATIGYDPNYGPYFSAWGECTLCGGANGSATLYFNSGTYQVNAGYGAGQLAGNIGYSNAGGLTAGGGYGGLGANYGLQSHKTRYSISMSDEVLRQAHKKGLEQHSPTFDGYSGGPIVDFLGNVTAGWDPAKNHDTRYRTPGVSKSNADVGLMTDMAKGAVANLGKPGGLARAAIGLAISPIYYGAVVIGGGHAYRVDQRASGGR